VVVVVVGAAAVDEFEEVFLCEQAESNADEWIQHVC